MHNPSWTPAEIFQPVSKSDCAQAESVQRPVSKSVCALAESFQAVVLVSKFLELLRRTPLKFRDHQDVVSVRVGVATRVVVFLSHRVGS